MNDIKGLLNSRELKEMADSGVKVYFLPHASMIGKVRQFNVPEHVEIPVNKPFQDILVESDVLITDISSNNFEMAYMDKPTLVYVPGLPYVKWDMPHYHFENMSKFNHLKRCKDRT